MSDRRLEDAGTGATNEQLSWDDLILVGIVARTHGNKGEVIVNPHTDFVEARFRPGARFETKLGGTERAALEVTSSRIHQGRPVIGVAGISSISEAERLAGAELRIGPGEQGSLPDGVYYHHQLVGCAVETTDGETIGTVVEVRGEMGMSRLLVNGPRRQVEIPLAAEYCVVDVERRRITVRPPEGLLDL